MQLERRDLSTHSVWLVFNGNDAIGTALTFQDALAARLNADPSAIQAAQNGKILAPSIPSKILCIGLNYRKHAEEMNKALPEEPMIFSKPPSSVLDPEGTIVRPPESKEVHYEGELAVVIAKRCRRVSAANAHEVIAGYTLLNDVTARDLQRKDVQYTRGKGFDTFAPFGPRIVTGLNPEELNITLRVNGEVRQSSPVSDMIFTVAQIIEHVSNAMTLEPGDIIATGTPSGVGELNAGDVVEVEIPEIGVLRNRVENEAI